MCTITMYFVNQHIACITEKVSTYKFHLYKPYFVILKIILLRLCCLDFLAISYGNEIQEESMIFISSKTDRLMEGPYAHLVTCLNNRSLFRFTCFNDEMISAIPSCDV